MGSSGPADNRDNGKLPELYTALSPARVTKTQLFHHGDPVGLETPTALLIPPAARYYTQQYHYLSTFRPDPTRRHRNPPAYL